MANKSPKLKADLVDVDELMKQRGARVGRMRERVEGERVALGSGRHTQEKREENAMRFANAVKGAAVLTVGLIVSGCAVHVRPAAVVVDPVPAPEIVVERPVVDVHVSRPVVVERRTTVVNRPVVVEKKTTVVVDKTHSDNGNHGNGNNGNHNGDKFSDPSARHDNGNHNGQDKKGGVAKNE